MPSRSSLVKPAPSTTVSTQMTQSDPKRRRSKSKVNQDEQLRRSLLAASRRKSASELKQLDIANIEEQVRSKREEGLEVFYSTEKGNSVRATKKFGKGHFICEYSGELLSHKEGKARERRYDEEPEKHGSYMYFFQYEDIPYCLDCTVDNGRLGRLLNHSKKNPNIKAHAISVRGRPSLIFKALRDIQPGEELCFDYGDRTRGSIEGNPWLLQ